MWARHVRRPVTTRMITFDWPLIYTLPKNNLHGYKVIYLTPGALKGFLEVVTGI